MENIVAILGVFLFWASLLWLPLNLYRVLHTTGRQRTWTVAALLSFGMVLMGFTRAMAGGTVMEAFAWSISWLMPVGLTWFARSPAETPLRSYDKWVAGAALISFLPAMPILPGLLRAISAAIW